VTATSKDGRTSTVVLHYKVVTPTAATVLYFANNSWVLTAQSVAKLNGLASAISADHLSHVTLSGFASSTGSSARNSVLGSERALTAWTYLEARLKVLNVNGVTAHVAGYGASDFNVRPYSAAGNRRTEIVAD
jgi:outer membrane protein OmpA-like peptidoglycan-associated protein